MGPRENRGIWAEALASAYLVNNGYQVFLGWGNTSCDILAMKDDLIVRIEVKAASLSLNNKKYSTSNVNPEKFDMLLVVLPDGTVLENPSRELVYQNK